VLGLNNYLSEKLKIKLFLISAFPNGTYKLSNFIILATMWVLFMDMHSGGGLKRPPYEKIYIEANSAIEAEEIFKEKVGCNPHKVTCECCGQDYSIMVLKGLDHTLVQGLAQGLSLENVEINRKDVLIIK
jgi:hypothetical protein